jgi:hypothetical protein
MDETDMTLTKATWVRRESPEQPAAPETPVRRLWDHFAGSCPIRDLAESRAYGDFEDFAELAWQEFERESSGDAEQDAWIYDAYVRRVALLRLGQELLYEKLHDSSTGSQDVHARLRERMKLWGGDHVELSVHGQ